MWQQRQQKQPRKSVQVSVHSDQTKICFPPWRNVDWTRRITSQQVRNRNVCWLTSPIYFRQFPKSREVDLNLAHLPLATCLLMKFTDSESITWSPISPNRVSLKLAVSIRMLQIVIWLITMQIRSWNLTVKTGFLLYNKLGDYASRTIFTEFGMPQLELLLSYRTFHFD